MRNLFLLLVLSVLVSCAQSRVRRFDELIEPKIGKATKSNMSQLLGTPVKCIRVAALERCEYRTASQRNDPVPGVHIPKKGMGPDVSPYEYFDVIHVFYDDFRVVRDWAPVVIHP